MEEAWHGSKGIRVERHNSGRVGWIAEQAQQRAEDCVRALKYLGKKSDCARIVGDTLGDALNENTLRGAETLDILNETQLNWDAGYCDLFAPEDAFNADGRTFL
jgi:hypothetical protein